MLYLNCLKIENERIESGWFKLDADCRALRYFQLPIVALDCRAKGCVSGKVRAIKLEANCTPSELLALCPKDYLSFVANIFWEASKYGGYFDQSVGADVYVRRTSERCIFSSDSDFNDIAVVPEIGDLETCAHVIRVAFTVSARKRRFRKLAEIVTDKSQYRQRWDRGLNAGATSASRVSRYQSELHFAILGVSEV